MKKVTLSAKWLGVVFAALFLAACSSNETKEAEARYRKSNPHPADKFMNIISDNYKFNFFCYH